MIRLIPIFLILCFSGCTASQSVDEWDKQYIEIPKSATRGHASDVYDRSAEKLRPLSLSERRQYLKDLRGVLIRKYKDPSDPQFHENFMPRFVRAMETRGIFFDEAAQR